MGMHSFNLHAYVIYLVVLLYIHTYHHHYWMNSNLKNSSIKFISGFSCKKFKLAKKRVSITFHLRPHKYVISTSPSVLNALQNATQTKDKKKKKRSRGERERPHKKMWMHGINDENMMKNCGYKENKNESRGWGYFWKPKPTPCS